MNRSPTTWPPPSMISVRTAEVSRGTVPPQPRRRSRAWVTTRRPRARRRYDWNAAASDCSGPGGWSGARWSWPRHAVDRGHPPTLARTSRGQLSPDRPAQRHPHPAHRGDAGRDGRCRGRRRRVRRGPDRPRAQERSRPVRARGRALHPDRLDGQRARRPVAGRARPGGPLRVLGPHRPRRARGARRPRRRTMRTWTDPAARSTCRSGRCSPPTWVRSSCGPRPSRSRTPTTSPGVRCSDRRPRGAAVVVARSAGRAPRRCPHLERPRGRRCRWRVRSRGRRGVGVLLSRGWARPSARCWSVSEPRSRRRGSAASGWAADAPGGHPRGRGCYALEHHGDRLAEDHAHARLLAEACGVDPAGVDTNIVVLDRPDAPASSRPREDRVLVSAVGPRTVRLVTHLDVSVDDAQGG